MKATTVKEIFAAYRNIEFINNLRLKFLKKEYVEKEELIERLKKCYTPSKVAELIKELNK